MKRIALVALLMILSLSASGAKPKPVEKNIGLEWVDANFTRLDEVQKSIFACPEPGYQEVRSSKILSDLLESEGFTIEWGVAGIPTAFVATFGSGSPTIGLLGEYDALPGMSQKTVPWKEAEKEGAPGHACGHNLLGTAAAASAIAVSKWLSNGHEGTVKFFGCPAEEGGGGKDYMVKAGCFSGCDAVFDWHPDSVNKVSYDTGLAVMKASFSFYGISAHAGIAPWNGRSALDGVESFNYMVNMMREHVSPDVRMHYIITNGGKVPNAVPDYAQVVYYFRHPKAAMAQDIFKRALKAAEGAAMGTGTEMKYEIINGSYERLINARLAEVFQKNLKIVGGLNLDDEEKAFCGQIQKNSGIETDFSNFSTIPDEIETDGSSRGSSDAGNVSQVVPLATLSVATTVKGTGLHTWQQAALAGTTVGTKAISVVAKVFYLSALDLYGSPATVKGIWDEYYGVQGKDYRYETMVGDREPPFDYCNR